MRMRKKLTLIVVMLLSLAIFASNMEGLKMAVQAADIDDFMSGEGESWDDDYDDPTPPQPDPEEEQRRREEEERQRQAEEEERQRQAEAAAEAQRQADEEARRQAEEEARKAQEEELKRQEAEAAKQAEEAAKKQAEEEAKRQAEEAAKQEALEREAKEAEEAAKKQAEEEAAAAEAKRLAEEEAKKAQEEAEKAKKAEEEAKKAQEEYTYGLRVMIDGGAISNLNLLSTVGSGDFIVFSVVNTGTTDVDLVYGISNASADVFALSLVDGSTTLTPSGMSKFQIALRSSAPVGKYSATIYIKDRKDDKNLYSRTIGVTGEVISSSKVTNVSVSPQGMRMSKGGSGSFYAQVQGTNVSQDVNWSVTGARSSGTYITGSGMLVVGSDESAPSVTVVATSVQDSKYSGLSVVGIQSNSYNVNVSADPAKGGMVSGGGAVVQGGSVTLSAVPNKNYYFVGWERDGRIVSTATNYTVVDVQYNMNVVAKFKQNYVTVNAYSENNDAGSVVGGGRITYGGRTTLSAKANNGYVFTGWREGDSIISTSASLELNNLTYDRTIVAKFSKTSYTITLACSPFQGGSVSGGGTFKLGESTTITATPAAGFVFQGWTVNDQYVGRDLKYRIDRVERDLSFTAVFIPQGAVTHTITAGVATTGGTISPSGVTTVARGSSLTYTITPKTGFAILAVAVDGVQVGPVSTYTFSDIKEGHAIAAAFVQTDAGVKKAVEAKQSGDQDVQTKKVQKVFKQDTPEVTEEHVVDLNEAASGTAGDDFIEEMDLSDIAIPTDEELGIVAQEEEPVTSEVLRTLGITIDEAKEMINNGRTLPILDAGYNRGTVDAYIDNQLAPPAEIVDYRAMSWEELEQLPEYQLDPSLPNFDQVVVDMMTQSEVLEIAEGVYGNVVVSLTDTDKTILPEKKKVIDSAVGQKPLKYFDLTLMKMVGGTTTNIKQLNVPMEVIIQIPEEIYKSGRTYAILREHDGELSILPDLDDDPKTITFKTDRFSSYAISEQKATAKDMAIRFMIGAIIALVIALTCFVILVYHHAQMRRARRRKKSEYV